MTMPNRRYPLPDWLDRLTVRAARFPWWALLIATGLILLFYAFGTSSLYRRVLSFVVDNPQATTTRLAKAGYQIRNPDGSTRQVRGVVTAENDQVVTLETRPEEQVTILLGNISQMTCPNMDVNGECAIGQPITIERNKISGYIILEDLGRYQLVADTGDTVNILKVAVVSEERTPSACRASPEGTCAVTLTLKPNAQGNDFRNVILLDRTTDAVVLQTVPPESIVIPRTDIVRVLDYTPDQCALNNLAACNEGPFLTFWITLGAFFIAVTLGLILGLMRISANPILFNLATTYVEAIRGVPMLVILLFVSFVFAPWFRDQFPSLAPKVQVGVGILGILVILYVLWRGQQERNSLREQIQAAVLLILLFALLLFVIDFLSKNSTLGLPQRAILGLGLGYAAFLAELFRAGIQSIGRGQMEAARSLGMTYVQAMRYVILPQAFRVVLPPLGNEFIAVLKDTSLAAVIAVPELTQKARLFGAATYRVFEAYITVGALYLCMTLFLSFLMRTIERRINVGH